MLAKRLGEGGSHRVSASKQGDASVRGAQSTASANRAGSAMLSNAAPKTSLSRCTIGRSTKPYHLFQSVAVRAHSAGPRDDMVLSTSAPLILGSASPRRR